LGTVTDSFEQVCVVVLKVYKSSAKTFGMKTVLPFANSTPISKGLCTLSLINNILFPAEGVRTMEHENISGMKYILPFLTSKLVQNL